ncbi:helix-turn-helix domain-containing protein [Salinibacterium sp. ZJ450]|uniref:helix-turn-helix domain-containing protein n=1 Tax=Salinibacterium sp. ZJ450 TaxID=2708338 RepID=UPI00351D885A
MPLPVPRRLARRGPVPAAPASRPRAADHPRARAHRLRRAGPAVQRRGRCAPVQPGGREHHHPVARYPLMVIRVIRLCWRDGCSRR